MLRPQRGSTSTRAAHPPQLRGRTQGGLENSGKRSCEWKWPSSDPNPQRCVILNFKTTRSGGFSQLQTVCSSFLRDILSVSAGTGNALVPAKQERSAHRPPAGGGIQVPRWVSEIHSLSLQNPPRCICGPCICGTSAQALLRAGAACAGGGGAQVQAPPAPMGTGLTVGTTNPMPPGHP